MNIFKSSGFLFVFFLSAGLTCYSWDILNKLHAPASTTVSGVNPIPACNPCKIFVTAGTFDGAMVSVAPVAGNTTTGTNGIVKADNWCMSDTRKPVSPSSSVYKAMLVDSINRVACTTSTPTSCSGGVSEHKDWVMHPNTPYVRLDGTTIIGTTDANGLLTTQQWDVCDGIVCTNVTVWAGLAMSNAWTSNASNCANWASTATTGGITPSSNIGPGATSGGICAGGFSLLCVEQ